MTTCEECGGYQHPLGHSERCTRKPAPPADGVYVIGIGAIPSDFRDGIARDASDVLEQYARRKLDERARDPKMNAAFPIDEPERPPREDYVRVTCQWQGHTVEPAVEYRDGDSFDDIAWLLKDVAQRQCDVRDPYANAMMIARIVGACIAGLWPDRAYFVEVWQDGREGFAQVFQPFGVPRNR